MPEPGGTDWLTESADAIFGDPSHSDEITYDTGSVGTGVSGAIDSGFNFASQYLQYQTSKTTANQSQYEPNSSGAFGLSSGMLTTALLVGGIVFFGARLLR